ncbi:MAG: serine hydrolase [Lactimicrobium massiliense]|jgi:CubicO group peptidase (beta-lactamase class C family)|nr:serine hydrolase domain-containing protein [Lactimicrobium massiliense]MDD6230435.1 serine hydrolase [Lactimicrobium massiliense]MDD6559515.1 serine hydrolase [Lactimicrobium massiliense]
MYEAAFTYLDHEIEAGHLPGASAVVVSGRGDVYYHGGWRMLVPEKRKTEADTLYDLASCTKVVATTTLVLQAMCEGLLSLGDPVCRYLPDFPHEEMTIRHLLTHTSGLPADDKAYRQCHGEKEMYAFICQLPLVYETGKDLVYSDFGFILLGMVLEKIYGCSLDVLAKKKIFDPLGMHDSGYCPQSALRCAATEMEADRGVIVGKVHDGKAWRLGGVSGNAGVFSNVQDLALFIRAMLDEHNGVIPASAIALLRNYRTEGYCQRRTLGWFADDAAHASFGDFASHDCLYHTGFAGASIYIDYARKMGIVLLTNRIHPSRNNAWIVEIRNHFHNAVLAAFDQEVLG